MEKKNFINKLALYNLLFAFTILAINRNYALSDGIMFCMCCIYFIINLVVIIYHVYDFVKRKQVSIKFSLSEKVIEVIALLMILIAVTVKYNISESGTEIVVIFGFVALLLFSVLWIAACVPITCRMTKKQKEKVQDIEKYQANYRRIFVVINLIVSIMMSAVILF